MRNHRHPHGPQTLAALGALTLLSTPAARADEFLITTRCDVTERHSTASGGSAGSFLAAAVSGAEGNCQALKGPLPTEAQLYGLAQSYSDQQAQERGEDYSSWPDRIAPPGIELALEDLTIGQNWREHRYTGEDSRVLANYELLTAFERTQSPQLVPLLGVAGHWGVVFKAEVTDNVADPNINPSCPSLVDEGVTQPWCIKKIWFYDAQKAGEDDRTGNQTLLGPLQFNGRTWESVYFKTIYTVDADDPYYLSHVFLHDPPYVRELVVHALETLGETGGLPLPESYLLDSPGILRDGEVMSARLAQERVLEALEWSAGEDLELAELMAEGRGGAAVYVDGQAPDGSPWPYYLVPVMNRRQELLATVQLDAEDGSFQMLRTLGKEQAPFAVSWLGADRATAVARSLVGGRRELRYEGLRWDAATAAQIPSLDTPLRPFHSFRVVDADGRPAGRIVVGLNGRGHQLDR